MTPSVRDSKSLIAAELDAIRGRLGGQPVPRDSFDRLDAAARRSYAERYVDAKLAAGHGSGTARATWVDLVVQHFQPAGSRLWLARRTARREARPRLAEDPAAAAEAAARRRAQAALQAWLHLRDANLADVNGEDLVAQLLAEDLPDPDAGE